MHDEALGQNSCMCGSCSACFPLSINEAFHSVTLQECICDIFCLGARTRMIQLYALYTHTSSGEI